MSLGFVVNGPEGLVLAADSRVTLFNTMKQPGAPDTIVPVTFDNATKLLKVKGHDFVGAITFGAGTIGKRSPRTAHSYLPELEADPAMKDRLPVEKFASKLSEFFLSKWTAGEMPNPSPTGDLIFLIGGYDLDDPYGKVYTVAIPSRPAPVKLTGDGLFGANWGGQIEVAQRILNGFDPRIPKIVREFFKSQPAPANGPDPLEAAIKAGLSDEIPWAFLPLQDCVDLSIFAIRATIAVHKLTVGLRGVGGAIDVATITRTDGFKPIQRKRILGEITGSASDPYQEAEVRK